MVFSFWFIFISSLLPPEAQKIIDQLPEKAITLDFVIQQAIQSSDSYKILLAQKEKQNVPLWQAESALDPQLKTQLNFTHNRNEPPSVFSPSKMIDTNGSIEFFKEFLTGTSFSLTLKEGHQELLFPTVAPSKFYETKLTAKLEQALLKNVFGLSTRKTLEAAHLKKQIIQKTFEEAKEKWIYSLQELFYQAWLAQREVKAFLMILERQKKLLEVSQLKVSRGTIERKDLLQREVFALNTEVQYQKSKQLLDQLWKDMIILLKFSSEWEHLDPRHIPLKFFNPSSTAFKICHDAKEALFQTTTVKKLELQTKAARLLQESARSKIYPDLKFSLQVQANGIDPQFSKTFPETSTLNHPSWLISLFLTVPFWNSSAKAELEQAQAETTEMTHLFEQNLAQAKSEALKLCENMNRYNTIQSLLQQSVKKQRERADLEDKQFQMGRSTLEASLQAANDATQEELQKERSDVELALLALKIKLIVEIGTVDKCSDARRRGNEHRSVF